MPPQQKKLKKKLQPWGFQSSL